MKPTVNADLYSFMLQPIVKLNTDQVVAHEILLREFQQLSINEFIKDEALFVQHSVSLSQCMAELQRTLTLENKVETLFANFNAAQLSSDEFTLCLEMFYNNGILPSSLAIEVTEQNTPTNEERFFQNIDWARKQGHPIVLDDFGTGVSNFALVSKLSPSLVKTDMSLIQGSVQNRRSRRCLKALVKCLSDIGANSVIEGIETQTQRDIAEEIGGTFGQGYFFEEPSLHTQLRRDVERAPSPQNVVAFAV